MDLRWEEQDSSSREPPDTTALDRYSCTDMQRGISHQTTLTHTLTPHTCREKGCAKSTRTPPTLQVIIDHAPFTASLTVSCFFTPPCGMERGRKQGVWNGTWTQTGCSIVLKKQMSYHELEFYKVPFENLVVGDVHWHQQHILHYTCTHSEKRVKITLNCSHNSGGYMSDLPSQHPPPLTAGQPWVSTASHCATESPPKRTPCSPRPAAPAACTA